MKSVIGMFVIFFGIYIVVANDMLSFFAQKSVFIFAVFAIIVMMIVAVFVLGLPKIQLKRGHQDDEDKPQD